MNQEVEEEEIGLSSEDLEKIQSIMDNNLKGKFYDDTTSGQLINDILQAKLFTLCCRSCSR